MNRLSASTLGAVEGADLPDYDRTGPATIAHLGIGAFARGHVALYADHLLRRGSPAAIRGVSLRRPWAEQVLGPQNGLYSVTTREPSARPATTVVGSVTSVATGVRAAVDAIAEPTTRLVTLTVTEKGYELGHPGAVPAVVARALAERRRRDHGPLVVASLDNLLDNGTVLRQRVLEAARGLDDDVVDWIASCISFPRSVVDRMVPATTAADILDVSARLHVVDQAAVVGEAHCAWVIEAVDGLPPLANVGVEIVADIGAHQRRKLWLLNGPHSALAYAGLLAGHRTIADAVTDPAIARFVQGVADDVVAVADLDGLDAGGFARTSLRRFANAALGHTCAQVGADGSRKLVQRLLPVMDLRLERGMDTVRLATVVAAWLVAATEGACDDPAAADLRAAIERGGARRALHVLGEEHVDHADVVERAMARVERDGVGALEGAV